MSDSRIERFAAAALTGLLAREPEVPPLTGYDIAKRAVHAAVSLASELDHNGRESIDPINALAQRLAAATLSELADALRRQDVITLEKISRLALRAAGAKLAPISAAEQGATVREVLLERSILDLRAALERHAEPEEGWKDTETADAFEESRRLVPDREEAPPKPAPPPMRTL